MNFILSSGSATFDDDKRKALLERIIFQRVAQGKNLLKSLDMVRLHISMGVNLESRERRSSRAIKPFRSGNRVVAELDYWDWIDE